MDGPLPWNLELTDKPWGSQAEPHTQEAPKVQETPAPDPMGTMARGQAQNLEARARLTHTADHGWLQGLPGPATRARH